MSDPAADSDDLRERVAAYAPRVYGFLLKLVGRRDVAEDLAQETLARALKGLATYRPEGKFKAWIFRIATNTARDWLRRRPREPALGFDGAGDAPPPAAVSHGRPETDALRREREAAVTEALARLTPPDREILLMRYYGDMAFKEIAEATGEPLGTVLARAHRALKKLGAMMPEDDPS